MYSPNKIIQDRTTISKISKSLNIFIAKLHQTCMNSPKLYEYQLFKTINVTNKIHKQFRIQHKLNITKYNPTK